MSEIKHFDFYIHRDYGGIHRPSNEGIKNEDQTRFDICMSRAKDLSKHKSNALWYFSSFLVGDFPFKLLNTIPSAQRQSAHIVDQEVREELYSYYGDRLLIFPRVCSLTSSQVTYLLKERNLAYNPFTTTGTGYGEYLRLCVKDVTEMSSLALRLRTENVTTIPELSLSLG